ncbi:hypothetical protein H2200_008512 [Cladophialophora chaetospira]|uniref:F-box domain-containing protein n=1 Tax=Cladophialophora chaetospira TaxID=386627 RepID=A0AA38X6B7_9EURO|nr:hypothetical protein H2200_008512 [Cladophialophora chaetospira]
MPASNGSVRLLRSTVRCDPAEYYSVEPAFVNSQLLCLEHSSFSRRKRVPLFHHFLDLPPEIRLEIYSYFARTPLPQEYAYDWKTLSWPDEESWNRQPPMKDAYDQEKEAIRATQNSLLLANRQIGTEFAPMFYRCTIIDVHAMLSPSHNPWYVRRPQPASRQPKKKEEAISNKDIKDIVTRATALDFESKYLSKLQPYKISNIRTIHYDASIWDGIRIWHPAKFNFSTERPGFRTDDTITNIDFDGLIELAGVLNRYKESLTSLELLELYGVSDEQLTAAEPIPMASSSDPQEVWRVASEQARWERVEDIFVKTFDKVGAPKAPLSGWQITRRVTLMPCSSPPIRHHCCIDDVGVVFLNPRAQVCYGTVDDSSSSPATAATPIIQLEYSKDWPTQ